MKGWVVIAAMLLALAPVSALASQASVTVKVSWTILPIAILSIEGVGHGSSVTVVTAIPSPSAEDLARGYLEIPKAVTLSVWANTDWTVLVQSLRPTLGASGGFVWPCQDLELAVSGTGDYLPLSTRPQPLITGGRGVHRFQVDYRVELPATGVPPGDYQAVVLYTVTTK